MRRKALVTGAGAAAAVALATYARSRRDDAPLATVDGGELTKVETSDGALLSVHIAGTGPTVVLAHCWTGTMAVWAPVAAQLVGRGHRVIRYDQRGHGGSTAGADGFSIERFGADLHDVLEALDLRDAIVAGHSLGGMSAQAFAIEHPDVLAARVRALVLVATASGGLASTRLGRTGRHFLGSPWLERAMRARNGAWLVRGALGRAAPRAAVVATRDQFVATPVDVRLGVAEAMLAMDLRAGRRAISVPTVVIAGTRDTLTPPRFVREIADDIPGARFITVKGAGHMLPYEVPDLLAGVIEEAAR